MSKATFETEYNLIDNIKYYIAHFEIENIQFRPK